MRRCCMYTGYNLVINGMTIPKGALFGKDRWGIWVCLKKELFEEYEVPTLALYRWNDEYSQKHGWVITVEQSETVDYIVQCANKFGYWKVPIEYPKYKGVHKIADSACAMHTTSYQKLPPISAFKQAQTIYENRHNNNWNQPMDIWESIAPMMYVDKVGKRTINRKNWRKTQYTADSKPYIVKDADK